MLNGIAAVLPHMQRPQSGHISNVSSVAGHKVTPVGVVYSATKHAVRVIAEGLRQEVKPHNLRTTIVSPGAVATEWLMHVTDEESKKGLNQYDDQYAPPADSFARAVSYALARNRGMTQDLAICIPDAR